ncbi:MAG: 6,7-dimethyl-8-ribityllumazine synthase [Candidatus Omnitrophota bacterium]|nr:MAG: 6,7-dimethyl-8-ribityllumazine synthase [Candidatus Omnitrophota bacterium]
MAKVIEANLNVQNKCFAIVVSRFNKFITSRLLDGALDEFKRHSVDGNKVDVFWTPGAFEIPFIVKKLANLKKYDAVIALAAIIKGETAHFQYVSAEVSKGIANVSLQSGIPVIFGVLTADDLEQAIERAGTKNGNKGEDAVRAAIEMANLTEKIENNQ